MKTDFALLAANWVRMACVGVLAFFIAGMAGCDGGDDEPAPTIVGTWTMVSEAASGCFDPLDNYSETYPCTATDCTTVTFAADGKFSIRDVSDGQVFTENGTYTITGDRLTICFPPAQGGCDDPLTLQVTRTTLTLTYRSADDGCTETTVLTRQ